MAPLNLTENALADRIARLRWPDTGFRCQRCGHNLAGWASRRRRPRVQQCRRCGKQQSVLSGTPLMNAKLPLRIIYERASRIDNGEVISSHSFAQEHGISSSASWHLTVRILSALQEGLDIPDDILISNLICFDVRCRRPKPSPPLSDDAPPELRSVRDAFARRRSSLRTTVVLRVTRDQAQLHAICAGPELRREVKQRRPMWAMHRGLPGKITAALHVVHRTVSLRWLPRYAGQLTGSWNEIHDRHRRNRPRPTLERMVLGGGPRPLHALRPYSAPVS